jgi:hypothetical protein
MNTESAKEFFKKNERAAYTILVIVVLLLAAFFLMRGQGVIAPNVENNNEEEVGETLNEGTSLSVRNQVAGNSVAIEKIALTATTSWIVIHADKDGVPGQILGAARFRPENTSGSVELVVRNTEPGMTYYAMVHTDDGDDLFSYKTDVPALVDGKEVMVMFKTTGEGEPSMQITTEEATTTATSSAATSTLQ